MSLRQKCVLASIGLILIGNSPVWSQCLLRTLDPDKDGTVDLAELPTAASWQALVARCEATYGSFAKNLGDSWRKARGG
jgi:hypothetical protein